MEQNTIEQNRSWHNMILNSLKSLRPEPYLKPREPESTKLMRTAPETLSQRRVRERGPAPAPRKAAYKEAALGPTPGCVFGAKPAETYQVWKFAGSHITGA